MKTNYKKIYRSGGIFALLVAVLGFASSCEDTNGYAMYGSPPVNFELKVKVVDSLDAPIKNIRVNVKDCSVFPHTDSEGVASFKFYDPQSVHARFEDVDGIKNGGQYRPLDTVFQFDGLPLQTRSADGGAGNNSVEGKPRYEAKVVMKRQ